jgi:hypothetical protein
MKEELASVRSLSGDRRSGESRRLTRKDPIRDFMMRLLVRIVVMGSGHVEGGLHLVLVHTGEVSQRSMDRLLRDSSRESKSCFSSGTLKVH